MRFSEKRLAELQGRQRRSVPASHLVVGLQCGGSDAFSGITCNPAVGYAADLLVRAGGTVLFSVTGSRCHPSLDTTSGRASGATWFVR
jgi:galactarate dehydratase